MTSDLATSEVQASSPTDIHVDANVLVVAEHPSELEAAQNRLIGWADARCAALQADWDEASKALEDAKSHKWRAGPFRTVLTKVEHEQEYMGKMREALKAGYCIVPNFPVDIIAIRIRDDVTPSYDADSRVSWKGSVSDFEQSTDALPTREGQWVDPMPKRLRWTDTTKVDGKDQIVHCARPTGWQDPRFPIHLAKPRVMDATQRAMALKCFDRIGVLPGSKKKVDPIVVGQIMRPVGTGYDLSNRWHHHVTTFMIAWFVDTKDLG